MPGQPSYFAAQPNVRNLIFKSQHQFIGLPIMPWLTDAPRTSPWHPITTTETKKRQSVTPREFGEPVEGVHSESTIPSPFNGERLYARENGKLAFVAVRRIPVSRLPEITLPQPKRLSNQLV